METFISNQVTPHPTWLDAVDELVIRNSSTLRAACDFSANRHVLHWQFNHIVSSIPLPNCRVCLSIPAAARIDVSTVSQRICSSPLLLTSLSELYLYIPVDSTLDLRGLTLQVLHLSDCRSGCDILLNDTVELANVTVSTDDILMRNPLLCRDLKLRFNRSDLKFSFGDKFQHVQTLQMIGNTPKVTIDMDLTRLPLLKKVHAKSLAQLFISSQSNARLLDELIIDNCQISMDPRITATRVAGPVALASQLIPHVQRTLRLERIPKDSISLVSLVQCLEASPSVIDFEFDCSVPSQRISDTSLLELLARRLNRSCDRRCIIQLIESAVIQRNERLFITIIQRHSVKFIDDSIVGILLDQRYCLVGTQESLGFLIDMEAKYHLHLNWLRALALILRVEPHRSSTNFHLETLRQLVQAHPELAGAAVEGGKWHGKLLIQASRECEESEVEDILVRCANACFDERR